MKKKQLLSALSLSIIVLAQAGFVSADEVTPVDPTAPALTTPVVPNPTELTEPVQPADPAKPTEPSKPVEPEKPTEPSQPTDPVVPTDPSQPSTPTYPSKPAEEPSKPSTPEQPKEEPKTPSQPTAPSAGKKDEPTEPATPPAINVPDVSSKKPIVTDQGQEIIGTQDSKVIVRTPDGTTQYVAPETIGAKKNSDGTVTVKTKEGKMETLPSTGEKASIFMSILGIGLLAGLAFWKKKQIN